ncbi:hypothetical protein HYC85_004321 [Camellia sinensis]|uniref:Uncharacterized protein n=1 Tax=Camellia sinensis TaxID=4442 RepID=A0A7J7HY85_CAMSI|nr:hypothetical protein HYC85_004321 [Camellia sinensis]
MEGVTMTREVVMVVMSWLIMGTIVMVQEQPRPSFPVCFGTCYISCTSSNTSSLVYAAKCLKHYIFPPNNPTPPPQSAHDLCTLGCASSLCTRFSTKENPSEEKVESCVDFSSNKCAKKYKSQRVLPLERKTPRSSVTHRLPLEWPNSRSSAECTLPALLQGQVSARASNFPLERNSHNPARAANPTLERPTLHRKYWMGVFPARAPKPPLERTGQNLGN